MAMIPAGNGEGPSSMYPKRQRRNGKDTEGEDHEKEEASCRNGSITWTVSDPEVFDCPVCYEPLAIPVFQCGNGHIACSCCSSKISDKCPTCGWYNGFYRNRAIEKVLELVRVKCKNSEHGCDQTIGFSKAHDHEKTCQRAPCWCPISDCNLVGSPSQLYQHFSTRHTNSASRFLFDKWFGVTLNVTDRFCILQEGEKGHLFILYNSLDGHRGNITSVSHIGASQEKEFQYIISVLYENSRHFFCCCAKSIRKLEDHNISSVGFFVRSEFFDSNGQCKLCILIKEQ